MRGSVCAQRYALTVEYYCVYIRISLCRSLHTPFVRVYILMYICMCVYIHIVCTNKYNWKILYILYVYIVCIRHLLLQRPRPLCGVVDGLEEILSRTPAIQIKNVIMYFPPLRPVLVPSSIIRRRAPHVLTAQRKPNQPEGASLGIMPERAFLCTRVKKSLFPRRLCLRLTSYI